MGTLTIENVTDKVIELHNNAGNEFVKGYKASTAGIIDARGISAYEIIEGSSADAIAGGNGTDIFIVERYQGSDNFYNA